MLVSVECEASFDGRVTERDSAVNDHTDAPSDDPQPGGESMTALLDVIASAGRSSDLDALLPEVARGIARVCQVNQCAILLCRDHRLVPAALAVASGEVSLDAANAFRALGVYAPDDIAACKAAIGARVPIISDDPGAAALVPQSWLSLHGPGPTAVVPLLLGDSLVGTVHLYSAGERITREQLRPAELLAGALALAVDHARLTTQTRRRLHEKNRLLRVALTIGSSLDVQEVLRRIARESARSVRADTGAIYFFGEDPQVLQPLVGYHVPKHFLETVQSGQIKLDDFDEIVTALSQERKSVWSDDVGSDPRFQHEMFRRLAMRSLFITPLRIGSKVLGLLVCVWWNRRHRFEPETVALLEGIAGLAAVALSNANRYSKAEAMAVTRERLRVARELHDTLNETIFSTALKLDACCREVPADMEGLRDKLDEVKQSTGNIMGQIRQLIYKVAPRPMGAMKLSERIRAVIEAARELSDVQVELVEQGDAERLDSFRQEILLKVVQEGLANIVKHARAARAEVRIDVLADEVRFTIVDDGVGARPDVSVDGLAEVQGHFGLRQMMERLQALEGEVAFGNVTPTGFRVAGRFPIAR